MMLHNHILRLQTRKNNYLTILTFNFNTTILLAYLCYSYQMSGYPPGGYPHGGAGFGRGMYGYSRPPARGGFRGGGR